MSATYSEKMPAGPAAAPLQSCARSPAATLALPGRLCLPRLGLRAKIAICFSLCAALPAAVLVTAEAIRGDSVWRHVPELAVAMALVAMGAVGGANLLVRPIEAITAAMRRRTAGERGVSLSQCRRNDERGDMAEAFDGMCAALGESESRLHDFASAAAVWLWETDDELRPTAWSQDLLPERRVFLQHDQAMPEGAGAISPTAWREHCAALTAREPFQDFRYSVTDSDGRQRHFRVSGVPIYDAAGGFRGYRGIGADETATMEARARAEHTEAVLLESIENISEGFALYADDGELMLCNSKYRDLAAGQIPGATMRDPGATSGQLERQLDDGRWVLLREWRTRGGGSIGIVTDISELKQRELEARVAKEQAELANRAKSEFLANMSHELRTPLNAIIGFSELMKSEVYGSLGDERYQAYATDIYDSGVHLLQIINDILDLSKIEAARFELHDEALYLPDTVRASVRIINQRAADAGVEVLTEVDNSLPPLLADQRCLKQILLNLLSNSVKFTLAGGTIRVRAALAEDGDLHLSVADSGIGIAEKDLPKALDSFSQVDSALSRKFQGTGLGLPLTKKLVELHGGTLAIESKVNVGTTVTAIFPKERVLSLPPDFAADEGERALPAEVGVC